MQPCPVTPRLFPLILWILCFLINVRTIPGCPTISYDSLTGPLPCFGTYKFWAPPKRYLAGSRGCTLQLGTNLVMSWYRCRPAVPRVLCDCRKHQGRIPCTLWPLFEKGEGFTRVLGVAGWVTNGGKRGWNWGKSLWQKSVCMQRLKF